MLILNAVLPDGSQTDVRISGTTFETVSTGLEPRDGEPVIEADGRRLMPGAIDVHVHFREPGATHKETWRSGSASAAAGGVTTVVDQPNTSPPTIDRASFEEKIQAASRSRVDFGINGGVTPAWQPEELFDCPLFALGEVFLADSTGDMGIDRSLFEDAVSRAADADIPVTVHAEDASLFDEGVRDRTDAAAWSEYRRPEAEVSAVETAIDVADRFDAPVHIAHASTAAGIDAASDAGLSCEVTPHHLFLSQDDLEELGTFGRMNPPLRSASIREAVWERLVDGTIDMVASDHAPHTRSEKNASIWEAPSGVPGVETLLPLLAHQAAVGELSFERVADVTAAAPAARFGLDRRGRIAPGYLADCVLLAHDSRPIRASDLHSACDWTPFDGHQGLFPVVTLLRGRPVFEGGSVLEGSGRNVR